MHFRSTLGAFPFLNLWFPILKESFKATRSLNRALDTTPARYVPCVPLALFGAPVQSLGLQGFRV